MSAELQHQSSRMRQASTPVSQYTSVEAYSWSRAFLCSPYHSTPARNILCRASSGLKELRGNALTYFLNNDLADGERALILTGFLVLLSKIRTWNRVKSYDPNIPLVLSPI